MNGDGKKITDLVIAALLTLLLAGVGGLWVEFRDLRNYVEMRVERLSATQTELRTVLQQRGLMEWRQTPPSDAQYNSPRRQGRP